ncbi:MAG: DUF3570 domain-containing protein [Deltaproteobacteria bacterium]|nr:DUF3570 domain-containing protein [Deltaproteobacteria bacterium]
MPGWTRRRLRLAWTLGATLGVVVSAAASAQEPDARSGSAALAIYADDDHVTVVSPSATVHVPLPGEIEVEGGFSVDVVSAASVDVVSQASPYAVEEQRYEGTVSLTAPLERELRMTLRAYGSTENDYDSLTLSVGAELDAFQRNTTFQLSYGVGIDAVGWADDPTFSEDRLTHRVIAGVTQVMDGRTFYDVTLDATWIEGHQESPYRFVPILDGEGHKLYMLPESIPDTRLGAALVVRLRHAIGRAPHVFLHGEYRLYADSWGIGSHTARVRGRVPVLGERLWLSAELRGYLQGAADFYRARVVDSGNGAPGWRTRDRVLGRMYTVGGQLGADLAVGPLGDPVLELEVAATILRFGWPDFPLQSGRTAIVTIVGARVPF